MKKNYKDYYVWRVTPLRIKYLLFFTKIIELYAVNCGFDTAPYFYGTKEECISEANFKAELFETEVIYI